MKPRKVYTPGCQSVKKGGVVDKAKDKRGRPKKMLWVLLEKTIIELSILLTLSKTPYKPLRLVCQYEKQKDSSRLMHISYIIIEISVGLI